MGAASQASRPRERLAAFLAEQYRGVPLRIQTLAYELGVSAKVAENLFNGHWPNDLVFEALVRRFGQALIDAIAGPVIDEEAARIRAEARKHIKALDALRARGLQVVPAGAQPEDVAAAWIAAEARALGLTG